MDTATTPPPILTTTLPLSLATGEALWTRHKNNPLGQWQPLAKVEDWRGENYLIAARVGGEWVRVTLMERRGRTHGAVDKTPRKNKGIKKSEANDKITVDG